MYKQGFTLIELLVVVMIVGVLTSIALPQYRKALDRSKAAEAMQMLPALFEARERWRILNHYTWNNGSMGETPTLRALDIEASGLSDDWKTKNFTYTIVAPGSGIDQACVKAVPRWGSNRNLTSAAIWYRGDKFSCNGNDAACDILNVADSSHRTGCQ